MKKGYDYFVVDMNTASEMKCKVCNSVCEEARGVCGPTSFVDSVFGKSHMHDSFFCPYSNEDWHREALGLLEEIEETHSKTIRNIMTLDLKELVEENIGDKE